jgi:transcriptional regulator with XRE-family HTH domain
VNGIDYSADSLEMLAKEQAAMTAEELRAWKHEMTLSINEMADTFGFSASTVKAYLAGESLIPVAVRIACNAMRENRAILYARFRPRVAGRPRKNSMVA